MKDSHTPIRPVILCGGKGTRLWPLSRELHPKQFMEISPGRTLFKDTVQRLSDLKIREPFVVCNIEHRFLVAEQLQDVGVQGKIILEPVGRNTAPAVASAALMAQKDEILFVMPADHLLESNDSFKRSIECGKQEAKDGMLVCFGIVPTSPETAYGYIHRGEQKSEHVFFVNRFIEKPKQKKAQELFHSGEYMWNSGMFMFRAGQYLHELVQHTPDIHAACVKAVDKTTMDIGFFRLDERSFVACPSDSIDYAVMEKSQNICVIPLDTRWSDLGSWKAMYESTRIDDDGNAVIGDVINQHTRNSYIHSSSRLVTTLGIEDSIVVETPDAVLVSSKEFLPQLKDVVHLLNEDGREEVSIHTTVYRPWGNYKTLFSGDRFKVKSITVNPGKSLSLQRHHHRAEHWVVVRGTAKIVNGENEIFLTEDQSTYIPLGNVHKLENPGMIPLEIIEVQTGGYIDEDDIERLEDQYGRTT
ncbi:MAG: mannose-1-phosphate guanylyltransferase/mannose-6-phosphate isomerase [Deltaproteobacteria bacterium]|nr:mannose-1-phosphate guanylyltransferase/mannose-6-phosphate isomerase [Candidatus Zymogenaceae bacterium]